MGHGAPTPEVSGGDPAGGEAGGRQCREKKRDVQRRQRRLDGQQSVQRGNAQELHPEPGRGGEGGGRRGGGGGRGAERGGDPADQQRGGAGRRPTAQPVARGRRGRRDPREVKVVRAAGWEVAGGDGWEGGGGPKAEGRRTDAADAAGGTEDGVTGRDEERHVRGAQDEGERGRGGEGGWGRGGSGPEEDGGWEGGRGVVGEDRSEVVRDADRSPETRRADEERGGEAGGGHGEEAGEGEGGGEGGGGGGEAEPHPAGAAEDRAPTGGANGRREEHHDGDVPADTAVLRDGARRRPTPGVHPPGGGGSVPAPHPPRHARPPPVGYGRRLPRAFPCESRRVALCSAVPDRDARLAAQVAQPGRAGHMRGGGVPRGCRRSAAAPHVGWGRLPPVLPGGGVVDRVGIERIRRVRPSRKLDAADGRWRRGERDRRRQCHLGDAGGTNHRDRDDAGLRREHDAADVRGVTCHRGEQRGRFRRADNGGVRRGDQLVVRGWVRVVGAPSAARRRRREGSCGELGAVQRGGVHKAWLRGGRRGGRGRRGRGRGGQPHPPS